MPKDAGVGSSKTDSTNDGVRTERYTGGSSAFVGPAASNLCTSPRETDLFRETPIRLLGYANEVGESFRALVPVSLVRWSYAIAAGYVVADTADKSWKMFRRDWVTQEERNRRVGLAAVDVLIWQSLASVIIPGFTINRICAFSFYVLQRATKLPPATRKWTTTVVGLSCIPFIIKPIDHSVDFLMDVTLRAWFGVGMQHEKNDP